jgi:GNAT superfamily N-acetyltransferase
MNPKRYPKEVVLKDCQEVTLRTVEPGDETELARFYDTMQLSSRWLLKEDPTEPETIRKWIDNHQRGRAFSIVAVIGETIVGHAALLLRPYGGRKHVARMRVMVAPDYRSKGLGTWMLFDLTKRAMEMGMEKLRTDFVVGVEDRAIAAVGKMGFVREALLKDYIRDENGDLHDYQIMIKDLQQEWSDF